MLSLEKRDPTGTVTNMLAVNNNVTLIEYLLGEVNDVTHKFLLNKNKVEAYPALTPLPKMYLREVNRFLFSGGLHFDISNALVEDPRQKFLDSLISHWKLNSKLEKIWQAGATHGRIGFVLKPDRNLFKVEFARNYEITEYTEDRVIIEKLKTKKQRNYIYRLDITPTDYIEYPLVPESQRGTFNWANNQTLIPHNYGELPFVCINNTEELFQNQGKPEFDFAALQIACHHAIVAFDLLENAHFFGSPLLVSPDPDDTIQRLKKRIQVLTKEPNDDGGGPEYLNIDPIKSEHLGLLGEVEANFRMHMGISAAYKDLPAQISNVALKTLNSATIDVAQSKWTCYVDQGLIPLLEKALRMAKAVGIISLPIDGITAHRLQPYFALSTLEKTQLAAYAQLLIDLGIDRATALQETIYPNLTLEQVNERLSPQLIGDI